MNAMLKNTEFSADFAANKTESDPRWAAVVARDKRADGTFFYSVRTTGVYCRPSCASRRARPENVAFHATRAAAEREGFRPCKRCKPDEAALADRQAATHHRHLPLTSRPRTRCRISMRSPSARA